MSRAAIGERTYGTRWTGIEGGKGKNITLEPKITSGRCICGVLFGWNPDDSEPYLIGVEKLKNLTENCILLGITRHRLWEHRQHRSYLNIEWNDSRGSQHWWQNKFDGHHLCPTNVSLVTVPTRNQWNQPLLFHYKPNAPWRWGVDADFDREGGRRSFDSETTPWVG